MPQEDCALNDGTVAAVFPLGFGPLILGYALSVNLCPKFQCMSPQAIITTPNSRLLFSV